MSAKTADVTASAAKPVATMDNIDPEGDVIMVVGSDKQEMRVNSVCLALASKVFRIMLGSNWMEGQGLSKDSPPRVTLLEDDAAAMRVIFYVLHHQNDKIPTTISSEAVLDIAVASDKYMLSVAMAPTGSALTYRPYAEMPGSGHLMTAAFLFRNPHSFRHQSSLAVLSYKGSYLEWLKDDRIRTFLPLKALVELENQRTQTRTTLADIVAHELEDCCNAVGCEWGEDRRVACMPFFTENNKSAIFQATVNDVIDTLRTALDELDDTSNICQGNNNWEHERTVAYEERFTTMKAKAGLCLNCVKAEGHCEEHTT